MPAAILSLLGSIENKVHDLQKHHQHHQKLILKQNNKKCVKCWRASKDDGNISNKIKISTPTLMTPLFMFFSPVLRSFIIFFGQLLRRVVLIIPFACPFRDLLARSVRSCRSVTLQKFEDKPRCDNPTRGAP